MKNITYLKIIPILQNSSSSIKVALLWILFLMTGTSTIAQDCGSINCTSNDIKITGATLRANLNGDPIVQCNSGAKVNAFLFLQLSTSTPRIGVSISGKVIKKVNDELVEAVGQCFGIALEGNNTIVKFTDPILWDCGTSIVLKDVLISWGTGNTNFCNTLYTAEQPEDPKCPATKSKCWRQPPQEYIDIDVNVPCSNPTITGQPGNQQKCVGSDASFTVGYTEGSPDATIQWQVSTNNGNSWTDLANDGTYSGVATATLSVSNVTTGMSGNRYKAVLTNNTEDNECGAETNGNATLTVYAIPGAPGVSVVNNCDGTSDLTATGYTGTLLWSTGESSASITVNAAGTYTVTQTLYAVEGVFLGCTSGNGSGEANPGEKPAAANVTYHGPKCSETTFSVEVTNVASGVTYSITDKNGNNIPGVSPGNSVVAANNDNITFSNIPAGSGYKVTASSGDCSASDDDSECGVPNPERIVTQASAKEVTIELSGNQPAVVAYPNPFGTTVNFKLVSPVTGRVSLDIYNASGIRIGNAFNGVLQANVPVNTEFRLSRPESGMLFYRMLGNGTSVSGKIMSVRQ